MIQMVMGDQDQIGLGTPADLKGIKVNDRVIALDPKAVMAQPMDVGG